MAITYLSGQRIQGLSEAGAVDGLGTAGLLNYNNGTYDASGKIGRCYSVSSTQYSSAASGAKANFKFLHEPSCKWSIAFWLKVASSGSGISDGKIIMGTADGGTGEIGTCLKMNGDSSLLLHIRGDSSFAARPASNNDCIEEDGNWHHYVMTYDQTLADYNMKIWKDGSAFTIQGDGDKESDGNSTSDPAEYFTVGGGGIGSGFAFAIDEISTWSRVLSGTEAAFLYDNNGGGTAQVTTNMSNLAGLKTYWNLNESTGNWANDASPTDEKTTVTDVPVGSEFEQTNDYKTYQRFSSTGNTHTFTETGGDGLASIKTTEQTGGCMIDSGHTLIGTKPTAITFSMYRDSGLSSGTCACAWRRTSDATGSGTPLETSDTVNNTTLTTSTSGATVSFAFDGTYAIEAGDYFLVESSNATGSQCKMVVKTSNGEANAKFAEWKTGSGAGTGLLTNAGYDTKTTVTYNESGWRERGTAI